MAEALLRSEGFQHMEYRAGAAGAFEAEMVKGAPHELIAGGSDWRILDRLPPELKG